MRHRFMGCLLVFFIALAASSRVEAADAKGHHPPVYKHGDQKFDLTKQDQKEKLIAALEKGAVEHLELDKQPDILALKWELGVWTIVVFLLLLFILGKVAWGPMLEGLKKREETIRAAVDEAKRAREETEKVTAEFKAKMDQAYAEIPKMMDEARRDAQRVAEEMRTKAAADVQADRQRLRREIELARDQALQEIWTQAAQLATLISAKAIKRSLSADDHRRLVDEALTELRENVEQHKI